MDEQQSFSNNQISANEASSYNPKYVRRAIIASVLLFFVIIITITIINPYLNHSSIAPVGPEVSSYLNSEDMSKIETAIKNQLIFAYEKSSDELDNLRIVIREDTFTSEQNSSGRITTANFIVDINSPELTYKITYRPRDNSVHLTCPSINLVQNPDIFCKGTYDQSTIDANLDQYLPYEGTTASEIDFSISHHGADSTSDPYLTIYASVCDDETLAAEVETAVKDWIRSKGIPNPDIIPLHFPHSYCNDRFEE